MAQGGLSGLIIHSGFHALTDVPAVNVLGLSKAERERNGWSVAIFHEYWCLVENRTNQRKAVPKITAQGLCGPDE